MAAVVLRPRVPRIQGAAVACIVAPALVHGFYVIWVGGDYMHARLLLPALRYADACRDPEPALRLAARGVGGFTVFGGASEEVAAREVTYAAAGTTKEYSVTGAAYGLSMLWTVLLTFPLMAAVQLM